MIQSSFMRKVILSLPFLCLVVQLGTISFMNSRLGRLRTQLTSARKESQFLQSQIAEANRKQKEQQGRRATSI